MNARRFIRSPVGAHWEDPRRLPRLGLDVNGPRTRAKDNGWTIVGQWPWDDDRAFVRVTQEFDDVVLPLGDECVRRDSSTLADVLIISLKTRNRFTFIILYLLTFDRQVSSR
jgi:hypothetical protein